MTMATELIETWRAEFDTMPVDAGDIVSNPRARAAFADAIPWPVDWLTARMIGRRIPKLIGTAVVKLPTPRNRSQRWSLRS